MRRAPAKPVRACTLRNWCLVSHVTFEAPLHTSLLTVLTLHTTHFTLHSSHCALRTLHSTLFTLHSSHSTLHTAHFTVHTSHCTLRTPNVTLQSPHFTFHSPHFTLLTSHCFLHTPNFTLHTSRPTLHTALFTLHTSSNLSSSHLTALLIASLLICHASFHESLPGTKELACAVRQPGPCVRALCEAVAVLLSKNMTCARPGAMQRQASTFLTQHIAPFTLHI